MCQPTARTRCFHCCRDLSHFLHPPHPNLFSLQMKVLFTKCSSQQMLTQLCQRRLWLVPQTRHHTPTDPLNNPHCYTTTLQTTLTATPPPSKQPHCYTTTFQTTLTATPPPSKQPSLLHHHPPNSPHCYTTTPQTTLTATPPPSKQPSLLHHHPPNNPHCYTTLQTTLTATPLPSKQPSLLLQLPLLTPAHCPLTQ